MPTAFSTIGAAALGAHAPFYPAVDIPLPPLRFGATFLERWTVREATGVGWSAGSYLAHAPSILELDDVVVHSSAGIVVQGRHVLRETCDHTSAERHHFTRDGERLLIDITGATRLAGTHISLLFGASANYYHIMIDCLGRLAALAPEVLNRADSVLFPAEAPAAAALLALMPNLPALRPVHAHETLQVDRLILPTLLHGQTGLHPSLLSVYKDLAAAAAGSAAGKKRGRVYIERTGSWRRKLLNENLLIEALARLGFVSVRLEELTTGEQIDLFRDAAIIVAPHGAGLANLGYASPGCRVLELHMDAYLNWSFRQLAALRGVAYDCILGRAVSEWPGPGPAVHGAMWTVPVPFVIGALESVL